MKLPFFYTGNYNNEKQLELDEDTSRHVVQVLRMKEGELLRLTDGRGNLFTCEITEAHKKQCMVAIRETRNQKSKIKNITIGISLIKNSSRFEWFLEKATEIGVSGIIPLICERTEKEKFRHDRMKAICISAMLQSEQAWLPVLQEPMRFEEVVLKQFENGRKFIAHCVEGKKESLTNLQINTSSNLQILIGPEGDFTNAEIELALQNGFQPVSLGETRLRTETAGVVAAVLLTSLS